jgi:transcriptional regulator with XRE-family HTH domain
MAAQRRLADYLRARRERLRPQDLGLAVGAERRRVPGLRREEVAILAGVSTDYYLRLEQGRDIHPSVQVLDALARALQLDSIATAYLHRLANMPGDPAAIDRGDLVAESTRWLIDSWPFTAAIIHNRYIDVLASNSLARALNPNYRAGVNSVRALLTDDAERVLHADWRGLAARSVGLLRNFADTPTADPRLDTLVTEGSASSALFRQFWDNNDVTHASAGVHVLRHPQAGELTLNFRSLPLDGTDGQSMFLYFAEPGTPSDTELRRLARSGETAG